MCGMAVTIWSTCSFERKYVVWLLQFGRLVILSLTMCGMAVIIWSTCGFELKYVWYGCYNFVSLWF